MTKLISPSRAKSVASLIAKHIWVVEGSSGEYEDHRTWIVCAYMSKDEAEQHRDLAQERAERLRDKYREEMNAYLQADHSVEYPKMGKNRWDKDAPDHEETSYGAYSVPLRFFSTPLTQSDIDNTLP